MSSEPPKPRDWLGYEQYAQTLWARVVHAFAQESARRSGGDNIGGDPLVVGVYGEWGVGKSRLLELMYVLAAAQSARDCALRALDPTAYKSGRALRLTVPVWFHPWKYEHEPHLSVPLLMHVTDALQVALKEAASLRERTEAAIRAQALTLGRTATQVGQAVSRGAKLVTTVADVTYKVASHELFRTATGLVAGYFGAGVVAERAVDFVKETSARIAGIDGEEGDGAGDKKKGDKKNDAAPAAAKAGAAASIDALPAVSADGRYYYNVQKYLRELSCITPEVAKAHGATIDHEVHLNFVVFVDDLDRCLPEKAVEVLEVIKTILNIESFAFVVALDDEVIERGISHRYRDYRFEGAKPQMPITGFEYLEKIVHLPFRLPQLSRRQARRFMSDLEAQLHEVDDGAVAAAPLERLWFRPSQVETTDPVTGAARITGTTEGATALVDLVLNSFESFVPRKLARTMELVHQMQQVLARRGIDLLPPGGTALGPVDARLVVFCALLQLFSPEMFRLLRRRPAAFGQWMRAYVAENSSRLPVFEWRAPTGDDLLALEVADADLYRWAALGSQAARPVAAKPTVGQVQLPEELPVDGKRETWAAFLASPSRTQTERHTVEQLRLPLVEALRDFRDAQRHAFAPLRLGAALAHVTQWGYAGVVRLDGYLQLFVDPPGVPAAAVTTPTMPQAAPAPPGPAVVAPAAPAAAARPVHTLNVRELMELVQSPDAATRASLVERLGLRAPEVIDGVAVDALATALAAAPPDAGPTYLQALAALAPHLSVDDLRGRDWSHLPRWPLAGDVDARTPQTMLLTSVAEATPRGALRRNGLDEVLGQEGAANSAMKWMWWIVSKQLGDIALRAQAGDLLSELGDIRMESSGLRLPADRGEVAGETGGTRRSTSEEEEPVFGFVRVPKGEFAMDPAEPQGGLPHTETIANDFFIARYLVTVDQYAGFVDEGYSRSDWGRQGQAWVAGIFDSPLIDRRLAESLSKRSADARRLPWGWEQQQRFGNRPVVNLTWFEARAFVRWLGPRLKIECGSHWPVGYELKLPTELQWERAARAASISRADDRRWPTGDDMALAEASANLASTRLGRACSVGLFAPNPLGLFDLAGNAWEWMDNLFTDVTAATRVGKGAELQAKDPSEGPALRGGSFQSTLDEARSTYRRGTYPDDFTIGAGIRLVLSKD